MSSLALPVPGLVAPRAPEIVLPGIGDLLRLPKWKRVFERAKADVLAPAVTVPHTGAAVRTTNGTTLALTLSGTPAAGSVLVVVAGGFTNVTSVSGGGVTTWTSAMTFAADTNHNDADIWWGVVDGTPSTGVTVSFATTSFMGGFVLEAAGAQKVLDASVAFANDASATSDSKSITTTTDGCLIVSGMSLFSSGGVSATGPTGYTQLTNQTSTTSLVGLAYLIQATHGASTMNWTNLHSPAGFPALGAVAIQPASVGGSNFTQEIAPTQSQGASVLRSISKLLF